MVESVTVFVQVVKKNPTLFSFQAFLLFLSAIPILDVILNLPSQGDRLPRKWSKDTVVFHLVRCNASSNQFFRESLKISQFEITLANAGI